MPQNPRGFRDPRILAALARNYQADYQFWAEEYITAVSQLHFIRKRNLPPLFDLFQGKLHTFEVSVRAAKLGLGEVKRFVDGARHEFVTKYNVPIYPELEDLSQKLESDPRIERIQRQYRRLSRYEDDIIHTIARIKISLQGEGPLESDDDVIIEGVELWTQELTQKILEAEALEVNLGRFLKSIRRSLVAIQIYHELTEESMAEMNEEEIANVPSADLNIFVGDMLRTLAVKNQDGQIILEDNEVVLPLMNHMDDSDDEEE